MPDTQPKEMQPREKTGVVSPAEQTKPGIVFTPAVDIFETEGALTLIADMPGVDTERLDIDLREDTLTISGDVEAPEGNDEVDVLREYLTGRFYRRFTLSEVIDQSKIDARLSDGILRLTLPKTGKATPRKINVKTG